MQWSAIQQLKGMIYARTRMILKTITINERSERQKTAYLRCHYNEMFRKGKTIKKQLYIYISWKRI